MLMYVQVFSVSVSALLLTGWMDVWVGICYCGSVALGQNDIISTRQQHQSMTVINNKPQVSYHKLLMNIE